MDTIVYGSTSNIEYYNLKILKSKILKYIIKIIIRLLR